MKGGLTWELGQGGGALALVVDALHAGLLAAARAGLRLAGAADHVSRAVALRPLLGVLALVVEAALVRLARPCNNALRALQKGRDLKKENARVSRWCKRK